jgi:hypothetical protein
MDSGCSRYMTENKKWFSSLTSLSHKGCVTLNDVTLVDRLRYNLLSVCQLCDAELRVLFHKSDSHVLDSSGKRVCGISRIENVFQANFSSAQSSLRCLIL